MKNQQTFVLVGLHLPSLSRPRLSAALFLVLLWASSGLLSQTETPDDVILGVSYVGLTVADAEASAKLYGPSADLVEVSSDQLNGDAALDHLAGHENAVAESRLLKSTNAQIRLLELNAPPATDGANAGGAVPVNGPGIAHVCYRSDGAIETYQRFLAKGVKPLGNPEMVELSPRFPVLYAYALDADGIMFEVEHVDREALPQKPPKGFYGIRHVSLASPDIERALSFYSLLLQNPEPRSVGGEEGLSGVPFDQVSGLPGTRLKMAWFQVGNLELELVQYLSHPTEVPREPRSLHAPGYNMIVFEVASLEAAKKRLLRAGGTVVSEPLAMDGGQILFGRDLDLNLLGFLVVPEGSPVSTQQFSAR